MLQPGYPRGTLGAPTRAGAFRGRAHAGGHVGGIVSAMTTPTFADADAAQWAFRLANKLNPDCEETKLAYDSLLRPLRGAGRSSYQIEIQPPVAATYRTMVRRVRAVVTTAGKFAAASGVCCLLFYVGVARSLFPGARWGSSCSTSPPSSAFASTWLSKSPRSTEPCREAYACPSCASADDSPSCAPRLSPACTPSSSSASSSSAS